jgi:hypothetical protein
MRNLLFSGLFAMTVFAIAPVACACQGCILPPPYTAWECGDVDCGTDGCSANYYPNGGSYCDGVGNRCFINLMWCANRQQDPPPTGPKWARATAFEQRWQLISVRVTHPRAKGRRA